jgi:hypothetical protein
VSQEDDNDITRRSHEKMVKGEKTLQWWSGNDDRPVLVFGGETMI